MDFKREALVADFLSQKPHRKATVRHLRRELADNEAEAQQEATPGVLVGIAFLKKDAGAARHIKQAPRVRAQFTFLVIQRGGVANNRGAGTNGIGAAGDYRAVRQCTGHDDGDGG